MTKSSDVADREVKDGAEQRTSTRISMLLLAVIRYDEMQPTITSRVLDLSSGGIRTSVPCTFERGHPVKVIMKGVGEVRGKVAWSRNGQVGIKFDAKIDTNAIVQALTGAPAASHIDFAKGPVPRPGFRIW